MSKDFMANPKKVVHTVKNTSFEQWKVLVDDLLAPKNIQLKDIHPLKLLHGYEGGDTPYGWADFYVRQVAMQARTINIKRDNPHNYD